MSLKNSPPSKETIPGTFSITITFGPQTFEHQPTVFIGRDDSGSSSSDRLGAFIENP